MLPAALLYAVAAAVVPPPDPVDACRIAHAGDSASRIVCLEQALRQFLPAPESTPVPRPAETSGSPAMGIGAEQVRARERIGNPPAEKVEQTVRILSVRYDQQQRGLFRTDSGQLWRELEVSPWSNRLSTQREYTARIERASLGGYRMYVDGERRMLKVERLQ